MCAVSLITVLLKLFLMISDSSKSRARIRARLRQCHKRYKKATTDYLSKNPLLPKDAFDNSIATMVFPWSTSNTNGNL
jgi:polyphosphate kinase 2 (PPK2 family)